MLDPSLLENKKTQGIDFVALGDNSLWELEMNYEGDVSFKTPEMERPCQAPVPLAYEEGGHTIYQVEGDTCFFEVKILSENCGGSEAMPQVEVNYGDKIYKGCGQYLSEAPKPSPADAGLRNTWVLESFEGNPIQEKQFPKEFPRIELFPQKNAVKGNTGCNTMGGTFRASADKVQFSQIMSTKMFCPNVPEEDFLEALRRVNRYEIQDLKLKLYQGEKLRLVFKKGN